MISDPKVGLENHPDLLQHIPQPKAIPNVRLDLNELKIAKINLKHLKAKNLYLPQYFSKKKSDFDKIKELTKVYRDSPFVKKINIELSHHFFRMFSARTEGRNFKTFSHQIKTLSSLQALDMIGGNMSDIDLRQLSQGLERLSSLKRLRLSCMDSMAVISDKSLIDLGRALKKLIFIEEIDLDFASPKITDFGVIKLSKGLKNCYSLRKLSLAFMNMKRLTNGISNKGLDGISAVIRKFDCLEKLELDFSGDGDGDAQIGLKSLSESLKKLGKLKEIYLGFSARQSITDQDLRYLGEGLKPIRLLNKVNLCFPGCEGITSSGFEEICEGLEEMELLNDLTLYFKGCKITDKGLIKFGEILPKMSLLESLYLEFRNCEGITAFRLNGLKEGLMKLTKIRCVCLGVSGRSNLKKDELEKFEAELEDHPNHICVGVK